jgi:hypothetical protein
MVFLGCNKGVSEHGNLALATNEAIYGAPGFDASYIHRHRIGLSLFGVFVSPEIGNIAVALSDCNAVLGNIAVAVGNLGLLVDNFARAVDNFVEAVGNVIKRCRQLRNSRRQLHICDRPLRISLHNSVNDFYNNIRAHVVDESGQANTWEPQCREMQENPEGHEISIDISKTCYQCQWSSKMMRSMNGTANLLNRDLTMLFFGWFLKSSKESYRGGGEAGVTSPL